MMIGVQFGNFLFFLLYKNFCIILCGDYYLSGYFRCRVDAPLAVVRPSQNPDLRLSRIRLFAERIVHIYQLYTLTYIRGLTSG